MCMFLFEQSNHNGSSRLQCEIYCSFLINIRSEVMGSCKHFKNLSSPILWMYWLCGFGIFEIPSDYPRPIASALYTFVVYGFLVYKVISKVQLITSFQVEFYKQLISTLNIFMNFFVLVLLIIFSWCRCQEKVNIVIDFTMIR